VPEADVPKKIIPLVVPVPEPCMLQNLTVLFCAEFKNAIVEAVVPLLVFIILRYIFASNYSTSHEDFNTYQPPTATASTRC